VLGIRLSLDQDQRLFVVVAVTGALGGLIHSARSLYAYVGTDPTADLSPPTS
jgi:hypothetical protein